MQHQIDAGRFYLLQRVQKEIFSKDIVMTDCEYTLTIEDLFPYHHTFLHTDILA